MPAWFGQDGLGEELRARGCCLPYLNLLPPAFSQIPWAGTVPYMTSCSSLPRTLKFPWHRKKTELRMFWWKLMNPEVSGEARVWKPKQLGRGQPLWSSTTSPPIKTWLEGRSKWKTVSVRFEEEDPIVSERQVCRESDGDRREMPWSPQPQCASTTPSDAQGQHSRGTSKTRAGPKHVKCNLPKFRPEQTFPACGWNKCRKHRLQWYLRYFLNQPILKRALAYPTAFHIKSVFPHIGDSWDHCLSRISVKFQHLHLLLKLLSSWLCLKTLLSK